MVCGYCIQFNMGSLTEYERKTFHVQSKKCTCEGAGSCYYCNLFICEICSGAESCLTTHCCKRKLTWGESEAVSRGELDFKDGTWERK